MQGRLKEAHLMALHLLCPILERSSPSSTSGSNPRLIQTVLEALRTVLSAAPSTISDQAGEIASRLISLLLPFLSLISSPSPENGEACLAMSCIEEVLNKPLAPEILAQIHVQILQTLSAVFKAWSQHGSNTGARAPLDPYLIANITRLLLQTFKRGLSLAEKSTEVAAAVQEVLRTLTNFAERGRSSIALLAATEAWHAVLSHLEELEAANWGAEEEGGGEYSNEEGPHTPPNVTSTISAVYKQGILHLTSLLLAPFFPGQAGLPAPPFLLKDLDFSEGSGAALEDWVAAVGGEGGSEENDPGASQEESSDGVWGDLGGDDDLEITRIMSCRTGSSSTHPSEVEIFAQQAEYFIAHAVSSYSRDLIPQLLNLLGPGMAATMQATNQHGPKGQIAYLRADFALRLAARCAPHLPTTALTSLPGPLEEGITGAHALQLVDVLLKFGSDLLAAIDNALQSGQHQNQNELVVLVRVGSTAFRALSPIMTTWLPQVLLMQARADPEVENTMTRVVLGVLDLVAGGLVGASKIATLPQWTALGKEFAMSASQTFLSLTSIALSSGMRPPVTLLHAVSASPAVSNLATAIAAGLQGQPGVHIPPAVLRPLGVGLSDLALRSWGAALQAKQASVEERKAAFSALTAPLLYILQAAATAAAGACQPPPCDALPQLCLAAMISTDIVNSYNGTPKPVREAAYVIFVELSLVAIVPLLKSLRTAGSDSSMADNTRLGNALLRFISSSLQSFPTELGTARIGELLSTLVAAFSAPSMAAGGDAAFAADVAVLSIIKTALTQGGNKHQSLVPPAMGFGLQLWERAASAGATHVKVKTYSL